MAECVNDGTFLIGVLPSSLIYIISIFIAIQSARKLKYEENLDPIIKFLHYIACILVNIVIPSRIIASVFCTSTEIYTSFIGIPSYYATGLCVIGTLFMRAYTTFKDSIYEITKQQKKCFIILYSINIVNFFVSAIIFELLSLQILVIAVLICNTIIYASSSIYGLMVFTKKMYRLTKNGAMDDEEDPEVEVELSEQQLYLVHATSKYISLLSVAIISTWVCVPIYLISYETLIKVNKYEGIGRCIFSATVSIDSGINLTCLFLQYPFAKDYYDKYCQCFANFWDSKLIKKTQNAMVKRRISRSIQSQSSNKNNRNHRRQSSTMQTMNAMVSVSSVDSINCGDDKGKEDDETDTMRRTTIQSIPSIHTVHIDSNSVAIEIDLGTEIMNLNSDDECFDGDEDVGKTVLKFRNHTSTAL